MKLYEPLVKTLTILLILTSLQACGPGEKGDPGQDGKDGTVLTIVKLCPGVTVYPSTFVEVAFCVEGKLYGTYSTNGGFSTELPPGTYGSQGVNSSCNFVIGENCQVSY